MTDSKPGNQDSRPWPMVMRGTPADAPAIRRLFDEAAVRTPNGAFERALFHWMEEATRILEGGAS